MSNLLHRIVKQMIYQSIQELRPPVSLREVGYDGSRVNDRFVASWLDEHSVVIPDALATVNSAFTGEIEASLGVSLYSIGLECLREYLCSTLEELAADFHMELSFFLAQLKKYEDSLLESELGEEEISAVQSKLVEAQKRIDELKEELSA